MWRWCRWRRQHSFAPCGNHLSSSARTNCSQSSCCPRSRLCGGGGGSPWGWPPVGCAESSRCGTGRAAGRSWPCSRSGTSPWPCAPASGPHRCWKTWVQRHQWLTSDRSAHSGQSPHPSRCSPVSPWAEDAALWVAGWRGAPSGTGWGQWLAERGLVCSSSNYVPSHCTALAGCNYTQLHIVSGCNYTATHCFWLQLQGYTLFLAAIIKLYMVFGYIYTHTYTFVWLQVHTQLHIFFCCMYTQLHIVLRCNYIHSYTLFLAAIIHKVTLFLDAITHTHTHTHTEWHIIYGCSYTVTQWFWLQSHSDIFFLAAIYIHSDTFFLAAISHTVTQWHIVSGRNYTHTVTHCFWLQFHTQWHIVSGHNYTHSYTVTHCFWLELYTQWHTVSVCNYSLHTQSGHLCQCDTLLLAESKTTHSHTLLLAIQFSSKTLIIPQGAILLWSWRAHKKYIKLRE